MCFFRGLGGNFGPSKGFVDNPFPGFGGKWKESYQVPWVAS